MSSVIAEDLRRIDEAPLVAAGARQLARSLEALAGADWIGNIRNGSEHVERRRGGRRLAEPLRRSSSASTALRHRLLEAAAIGEQVAARPQHASPQAAGLAGRPLPSAR